MSRKKPLSLVVITCLGATLAAIVLLAPQWVVKQPPPEVSQGYAPAAKTLEVSPNSTIAVLHDGQWTPYLITADEGGRPRVENMMLESLAIGYRYPPRYLFDFQISEGSSGQWVASSDGNKIMYVFDQTAEGLIPIEALSWDWITVAVPNYSP